MAKIYTLGRREIQQFKVRPAFLSYRERPSRKEIACLKLFVPFVKDFSN